MCQFGSLGAYGTEAHRGSAAQRGQGIASAPPCLGVVNTERCGPCAGGRRSDLLVFDDGLSLRW
jgi:hypothetical protein